MMEYRSSHWEMLVVGEREGVVEREDVNLSSTAPISAISMNSRSKIFLATLAGTNDPPDLSIPLLRGFTVQCNSSKLHKQAYTQTP